MDDWMNVISKRELSEDDILKLKFLSRKSKAAKKEAKQKYGKNAPKPNASQAYQAVAPAPNMGDLSQMTPEQKNTLIDQARVATYPVPQNTGRRVALSPPKEAKQGTTENTPLPQNNKPVPLPTNANTPANNAKAKQQQAQQAAQKRKQLIAQAEKFIAEGEAYGKQGDKQNHDLRIAQVKQILAALKA